LAVRSREFLAHATEAYVEGSYMIKKLAIILNFVPAMVTVVPIGPEDGEKEPMVGT